jgi:hypothetical protein
MLYGQHRSRKICGIEIVTPKSLGVELDTQVASQSSTVCGNSAVVVPGWVRATILAMPCYPIRLGIAIVDDDPSVLNALRRSLRARNSTRDIRFGAGISGGFARRVGGAHDSRLANAGHYRAGHLRQQRIRIPTIIIAAHGDAAVHERSESSGAVAFLSKPLRNSSLFEAIDVVTRISTGPE